MPRIFDAVFVTWLAWCTLAYTSHRIGGAVTAHLASVPAAVLAALVGAGIAVHAWGQRARGERQLDLVWPHVWARPTQAGAVGGGLWLAILALDVANGRVRSVFGIYIVLALLSGYLRRPRHEPGSRPNVTGSVDAPAT